MARTIALLTRGLRSSPTGLSVLLGPSACAPPLLGEYLPYSVKAGASRRRRLSSLRCGPRRLQRANRLENERLAVTTIGLPLLQAVIAAI